jgi:menaquinone-dependent protoporphyrinogen oxidase
VVDVRVLVAAASRHGSTLEIAQAIGRTLSARGLDVLTLPAEEVDAVDGFDAAVLGSAVYYGHWLEPARDLAEAHAAALAGRPVWLFSSGPLGDPDHRLPPDDALDVSAQAEAVLPVEHRIFAGKLDRQALAFREKAMVAALKAPVGDFRDWEAIEAFAHSIADRLLESAPSDDVSRAGAARSPRLSSSAGSAIRTGG